MARAKAVKGRAMDGQGANLLVRARGQETNNVVGAVDGLHDLDLHASKQVSK